MPDLTLTFVNPRLLDDVSFHPCVRFKRWEVLIRMLTHWSTAAMQYCYLVLLCSTIVKQYCVVVLFCLSQIDAQVKLSGMPDLTLNFVNPSLFDDVSFHPCIRLKRWEVGPALCSSMLAIYICFILHAISYALFFIFFYIFICFIVFILFQYFFKKSPF